MAAAAHLNAAPAVPKMGLGDVAVSIQSALPGAQDLTLRKETMELLTSGSGALATHAEAALASCLEGVPWQSAPACLAAVTYRGRLLAFLTRGEPRRDGSPTRRDTVFRIASLSKSVLAATALALRDDGMLDLHVPATRYLPGLATARFDQAQVTLTLDELLSNRGGLVEDNPWGDEHLGSSRAELAGVVDAGLMLSATPGTEYQYSNVGISLVGRAIEAVTGQEVEEIIRERLLDPLGLRDTRADASLYPPDADLAVGFRTFDDGRTFIAEPYVGSGALACIGSLFSTASDIAAWMHFLGSGFDDHPMATGVLSAASRRQMQTARTLIPIGSDRFGGRELDGMGYGYGLIVEHDRRFGRIVQHNGGLPGFAAHMRWQTATGLGVVVFGNSDSFGAGLLASAVLTDVLTRCDAPAAIVRPWRETVAAARRLDAIVTRGESLADVASLLARNVLRNVPEQVRMRRLGESLDEVGPVRSDAPCFDARVIGAAEQSSLRWAVPCERGALICDVHLMGLHEPLVQTFSIRVADSTGRKPQGERPMVTDHHLAQLG